MKRRPVPRLRDQSLNRLIPNMLTVMALCAGLTSIRYTLDQRWELAAIAIVIAAVLDGLDGRIARLLDGASKFGAELDSLSDFIGFGVAPALLLYYWCMRGVGGIGWVLTLLFAVCCALRLARFNTKLDNTLEFGRGLVDRPVVVGPFMLVVAGLMISRVPTYSFKRIKVPHRHVGIALLSVGAAVAFLVSTPWITLLAFGAAYIASLPFSHFAYQRLSQQKLPIADEEVEEPTESQ
jgi:CDP-diacylglycerol--serine O-phosphatidyltransferase